MTIQIGIGTIGLGLLGILFLVFLVKSSMVRGKSIGGTGKGLVVIVLSVLMVGSFIGAIAVPGSPFQLGTQAAGVGLDANGNPVCDYGGVYPNCNTAPVEGTICPYSGTWSYSAIDENDNTISVTGTSYYKVGNKAISTTAQTAMISGTTLKYWVSNSSTYYVKPMIQSPTVCGSQTFQALGIKNTTTVTISVIDTEGVGTDISAGVANVTKGAGGSAHLEISYVGVARESIAPFGGLLAVEYNISAIDASKIVIQNDNIIADDGQFRATVTPTVSGDGIKYYKILPGFDDATGKTQKIIVTIPSLSGVNPISYLRFTILPANNYVTIGGDIKLDVQENENGGTTKTGLSETVIICNIL